MTTPPPGGYPPPMKRPRPSISAGLAVVGVFVYFMINFVLGFIALASSDSFHAEGVNTGVIVTAVLLVAIAFGCGGAMLASYSSYARGFGLGLMIGWALTSIFTVGICTGLNPEVYSL